MTFTFQSLFPAFLFPVSMTAVVKNEIAVLTFLFRGFCLRKRLTDVFHSTHRCISINLSPNIYRHIPAAAINSLNTHHLFVKFQCDTQTQSQCLLFCQKRSYAKTFTTPKKPLSFDYSGDLVTQKPLDHEEIHADFKVFSQLQNAPEPVQKLFSIDFATGQEKKIHRKEEMRDRIIQLFGPSADHEMHVAMLTVDIRNMIQHCLVDKKDKLSKSRLVEKIQLRKKILKYLRRKDYQRFLWLLQELRIRYVLPPDYYRQITKKYRRKQQVWEEANNLRLKKIADLKTQLEAERAEFMHYKEEVLMRIQADAAKYDLDLEEFAKKLERKRIGKTYPYIYTWEERQLMEKDAAMK